MTNMVSPTEIESKLTEIVEVVEDCHDCTDNPIDLGAELRQQFTNEYETLIAILGELIMLRGSINDLGSGLADIGNMGIGSLFGGMFGKKD